MSLRRSVAGGLGALAFRAGLHRPLLRDHAVVAVFHRIDDRYPGNPITTSVPLFTELCEFFARYFTVVPFGRLVSMVREGRSVGGQLAISFDDGYRDNHRVAAPILARHGLPACFFVTTGFIGSEDSPPWDAKAGIASEWMSWDEVRDLRARGFEIGAHTVSHADLGRIEGVPAQAEIVGSRSVLEEQLGMPITLFAYPFGREKALTEGNRTLVREAGFICCASAFGGTVRAGDDPYHLRRMPISEWHQSAGQFGLEALRGRS
jgi:peptidoglycan/xylan/chitin deacetylase (PgdA/CDA1 family)